MRGICMYCVGIYFPITYILIIKKICYYLVPCGGYIQYLLSI